MELKALIAECTAYDFKVMLEEKKPKSWLKNVSAFANGLGGSLFFGIDNNGLVKGLDDVQHVCEAISSKIRDYMDPLPEVEMIPHDVDGLHIIQLKVNAGHYTPYYYVGDGQRIAFVRVGDESLPATAEQMVRLVLKGSNKTYDSLHTDYKFEDYAFTILANTFNARIRGITSSMSDTDVAAELLNSPPRIGAFSSCDESASTLISNTKQETILFMTSTYNYEGKDTHYF